MTSFPEIKAGANQAIYNIGAVSRLTGISMATLRAWERRYNFPQAERTGGGHRLYSEQDVIRLRWVKDRVEEGMQTAQAVNALRYQEQNGKINLLQPAGGLKSNLIAETPGAFSTFQQRLFELLSNHDLEGADRLLSEILVVASVEEIILEVMIPVLVKIGEAWENRTLNIATEHLSTYYLRQCLLAWIRSGPPARNIPPIVMACAPGEWHEGGLLAMAALLRRRAYPVAYLGQTVPLSDLANFAADIHPGLILLTATTEESAAQLAAWPEYFPGSLQAGSPIVAFAGQVFLKHPEWRSRVPGAYLGDHVDDGLAAVETMF